jgi:hypothetical protein
VTASNQIDWEFVLGTLETGRCVLFIGPETATDEAGVPLPAALAAHLDPGQNPNILQHYPEEGLFLFQDAISKTKTYYRIKKFYQSQQVSDRYRKLAQLPFRLCISINPDMLMAQAVEAMGLGVRSDYYRKQRTPSALERPLSLQEPMIYNLFGHIDDEESLLLTHNDLFDFLLAVLGENKLPKEIREALQDADDYIFLGFDFSKWYVQLVLRLLNLHNDSYKFARYASNKALSEATKQFCRDHFKIEFSDTDLDAFIQELHRRSGEAGLLREASQAHLSKPAAVEQAVKGGHLEEAMRLLEEYFREKQADDLAQELVGLQGRFQRMKRKEQQGVAGEEESSKTYNQISLSILELNQEAKGL